MDILVILTLTVFIIYCGLTPSSSGQPVPLQQTLTRTANDGSEIQENFQNLFDSIVNKDSEKSETYRDSLKEEVARERHAFGAMKEELQVARTRNYNRKSYASKNGDNDETKIAVKREVIERDPPTTPEPPYVHPDTFYREMLQQAIELMWTQDAHLTQMKIRESRIRRKSKHSAIEMQNLITDTDALYKREIDILADRFWSGKQDQNQKYKLPLIAEVVEHFIKNWKKFEELVDTDFKNRENVETECKEIKEEMSKAQTNLSAGFEELKEQMKTLSELRDREKKKNKQKERNKTTMKIPSGIPF